MMKQEGEGEQSQDFVDRARTLSPIPKSKAYNYRKDLNWYRENMQSKVDTKKISINTAAKL